VKRREGKGREEEGREEKRREEKRREEKKREENTIPSVPYLSFLLHVHCQPTHVS
jgi:hypothetical protein